MKATTARKVLRSHASPEIAASSASYFKTGPGEYGAGDKFIGVRVPTVRLVAREFQRFLARHASRMPRTMLRCAIEKFSSEQRQAFLNARPKSPS